MKNGAASRNRTGIPWLASRNPALERWPHFELMKTNTAASPVMDSHPQENFTADLSVFQAHLPSHVIDIIMLKPLVCDMSPGRGNRTMQILQPAVIGRLA
jgi:hypothetical protein